MNNKRRHKRFKLNASEVNSTVMFSWNVKVIDISLNGVSLESTKRLNLGNSYALRLTDKEKSISLKGSVVWSSLIEAREDPSGDVIPVYNVGMKFSGMSPEKGIEIHNFIHKNQKSCEYSAALEYQKEVEKVPVGIPESGPDIQEEVLDEPEHMYNWREGMFNNRLH